MRKNRGYIGAVSLVVVLAVSSACNSDAANSNSTANGNANATANKTTSTNSAATETAKKEASPLTISPAELLADTSAGDKYKERELTVTGVLMEIDPSPAGYVNVGEKGKKDYVKCEGPMIEYTRERFEIRELEGKGKTMTGTVKGTFKEFKTDGGARVAVLTSCKLSDVKK
jgi:hypothetical protein